MADARNALCGRAGRRPARSRRRRTCGARSPLSKTPSRLSPRATRSGSGRRSGRALAALRHGAYDVAIDATARRQVERARAWLLIRDFRQITRFTRPGVDATKRTGRPRGRRDQPRTRRSSASARTFTTRTRRASTTFLDEADQASERGYDATLAESAALVNGYWQIISPEYEAQRVGRRAQGCRRDLRRHRRSRPSRRRPRIPRRPRRGARGDRRLHRRPLHARGGGPPRRSSSSASSTWSRSSTTAARTTARSRSRSRFRRRSPSPRRPSRPSPTSSRRSTRDRRRDRGGGRSRAGGTRSDLEGRERGRRGCLPGRDRGVHETAASGFEEMAPEEWLESSSEADFDLVDISLDQMEAAVSAGEREQAEQARLSAYAFFEFGPERLLRALDPALDPGDRGLHLVRRERHARPGRADRERRHDGARRARHAAGPRRGARAGARDHRRRRERHHRRSRTPP